MKYAMIVPDGLGDWPIEAIGGKTPMEAAEIPNLHALSKKSILGTLRTAPEGMYPGSDVCSLSLMGYDPSLCYTGRAPLEAANLGILLAPEDVAFRCNLVTVEGDILSDYSAGHVTNEEAKELIEYVAAKMGTDKIRFYPGKMYRHIMVLKGAGSVHIKTDQPHDFQGDRYDRHWPQGEMAGLFTELTLKSREILEHHPVNLKRSREGKGKANMIWLWGGGGPLKLEKFRQKFGVEGGVISAVDLLNGIGRYLDLENIHVPGATGYFDTDYRAKGEYAIRALDRMDLVFVHVEATDEAGHGALVQEKIKAIEQIDKHIVGPVLAYLAKQKAWRMAVLPDHFTPCARKTHVAEPVPFIFAGSDVTLASGLPYTEKSARSTGIHLEQGYELMNRLINGWRL